MRIKNSISDFKFIGNNNIKENIKSSDIFITKKGLLRTAHLIKMHKEESESNSEIIFVDDEDFLTQLESTLMGFLEEGEVNITFDVSLIHRKQLAISFEILLRSIDSITIKLSFLYSLAQYVPSSEDSFFNDEVESVGALFSGWSQRPGLPITAIVGLGYEKNKALGAIEYLECSSSILLRPNSSETKYLDDLNRKNETLLSFTSKENVIDYNVQSPIETLLLLDSLVSAHKNSNKVIILPFGPKIFYVCALLVSIASPEVAVWNVSSVDKQNALTQDREVVDTYGFSCCLTRRTSTNVMNNS